jgi:hypothetical protein
MIIKRAENKTIFDTNTGILCRGVEKKPSAPELIDLKVTNQCNSKSCGEFCYMSSHENGRHADLDWITQQLYYLPEPPLQIAVGGGEPTLWPDLVTFVHMCKALGIVINTAVGPAPDLSVLKEVIQANYMSAVGISCIDDNFEKIYDVARNGQAAIFAHCILRADWMQKWIDKIDQWPEGLNGIIFLLFKPCGKSKNRTDLIPSVEPFYELLNVYKNSDMQIGFDSCTSELLKGSVEEICIDDCDGGQYSLFVDAVQQTCGSCSFLPTKFDLNKINLKEAWRQIERVKNCQFALRELK